MRLVVQRVKEATCIIDNEVKSSINHGYMVLLGVSNDDNKEMSDWNEKRFSIINNNSNGYTNLC